MTSKILLNMDVEMPTISKLVTVKQYNEIMRLARMEKPFTLNGKKYRMWNCKDIDDHKPGVNQMDCVVRLVRSKKK